MWRRTPGCRGQKLKSGQRRDRKRESGGESKKASSARFKYGLIPLYPAVLPHFRRPLPRREEEKASYLHQITFLYTPPHWPYHEAYPENGAQRSRSRRPHPFQVSVEQSRVSPTRRHARRRSQNRTGIAEFDWRLSVKHRSLSHLQGHPHI